MFPKTYPPAPVAAGPSSILRALGSARQPGSVAGALKAELQSRFHERDIRLYGSGTHALFSLLHALRKQTQRRFVAVAAYTCPELAAAIIRAGFHVALLDLRPRSAFCSADQPPVEWTEVAAVVLSNLYGFPEPIDAWQELAGENGFFLIDDACQSGLSSGSQGRVGARGKSIGILSFGRGKAFSGVGGGALLLPQEESCGDLFRALDPDAAERRSVLRDAAYGAAMWVFGNPYLYTLPARLPFLGLGQTHCDLGFSVASASPVALLFALAQLSRLDQFTTEQLSSAGRWARTLPEEFMYGGSGDPEETVVPIRIPILCKTGEAKRRTLARLEAAGLGATGSYPKTLAEYRELTTAIAVGKIENAIAYAERIITLPVHAAVTEESCRRSVEILLEYNGA